MSESKIWEKAYFANTSASDGKDELGCIKIMVNNNSAVKRVDCKGQKPWCMIFLYIIPALGLPTLSRMTT